jgi:hypothetical protein
MTDNLLVIALTLALAATLITILIAVRMLVAWLINLPFNGAYSQRRKALLREGVVASATILSLHITRGSINRAPVGQMRLEVHPPDPTLRAFETQVEYLAPRWRVFRQGQIVTVRYDPAQPEMLEIENVRRADFYWGWRIISQTLTALFPTSTVSGRRHVDDESR